MGAHRQALITLTAALALGAAVAQPRLPEGEKSITLVTRDGQRTRIGAVIFEPADPGRASFRISMDHAVLKDHFLSMREFKCLPAAQEISCFVPYPYPHPGTVSATDFSWLEHNLLFFFKQPADFGAKLWNGMIFTFKLTPSGLVGTPQAVDLNRIGAPPERPDEPPFGRFDRDDFSPGSRWVQELRIE
ncbi:MAG: hypothetical protein EP308_06885 [Burkholderiales bacterium]|nr:MAG: hypothetical protein EP308_06885 [Burkholderiales bacterium]